jgi:hypothetical protein
MREQAMIAHTDTQTACYPIEQHRGYHCGPTPEEESGEGADMKDAQENAFTPIDVPFRGHYFSTRLVRQNHSSGLSAIASVSHWLELGQVMFALKVSQLYSATREYSLYFEGTFVGLSTRHYLRAERHLRTNCGTADE